jgi:hypothetical protein
MRITIGERHVTVRSVDIKADVETGRRLALFLFALATDRPGYTEEDVVFTCTVEGESFDVTILISAAQQVDEGQYAFQGVFQDIPVEGSFKTSGYTGVVREAG